MNDTLVGVLLGGLIGIAGTIVAVAGTLLANRLSAAAQRKREHEARVHGWRSDAYKSLLRFTRRVRQMIETTIPVIGQGQEPPPAPGDDEVDAMDSDIAAFGSPEVRVLLEESRKLQNRFWVKADRYHHGLFAGADPADHEQFLIHEELEDVRKQYRELYERMRARVATELQEL